MNNFIIYEINTSSQSILYSSTKKAKHATNPPKALANQIPVIYIFK